MNYHPTYLWKVLKKEKNTTFTDLVNQVRIERAHQLLLTTELSVAEIAQKLITPAFRILSAFSARWRTPLLPDTAGSTESKPGKERPGKRERGTKIGFRPAPDYIRKNRSICQKSSTQAGKIMITLLGQIPEFPYFARDSGIFQL